jgi:uncharacterized glyoxalase superfamily protein PhnB
VEHSQQVFYPAMRFLDADRALRWLADAFGFEEAACYRDDRGVVVHAEIRFHGALFFFGQERESDFPVKPPSAGAAATGSVYVAVPAEEIDAHYERAKRAGAHIFRELCTTEYGSREYSVFDCEGHPWSFGTYRP